MQSIRTLLFATGLLLISASVDIMSALVGVTLIILSQL